MSVTKIRIQKIILSVKFWIPNLIVTEHRCFDYNMFGIDPYLDYLYGGHRSIKFLLFHVANIYNADKI
jgi:hypothetical protein